MSTSEQREHLFNEWLRMMVERTDEGLAELWTDDVVQENPYAPPGYPPFLRGCDEMLSEYGPAALSAYDNIRFSEPEFHHTDGDIFWAEVDGEMDVVATGKRYENKYAFRITVRDGQMSYVKEYYNPMTVLDSHQPAD